MHPKRLLIIGTVAFFVSLFSAPWSHNVMASPMIQLPVLTVNTLSEPDKDKDKLLSKLGLLSEEELRVALYNGKSLAQLATASDTDPEQIVNLQVAELTEQLQARLDNGSISYEQYRDHLAELRDVVTRSVYGA